MYWGYIVLERTVAVVHLTDDWTLTKLTEKCHGAGQLQYNSFVTFDGVIYWISLLGKRWMVRYSATSHLLLLISHPNNLINWFSKQQKNSVFNLTHSNKGESLRPIACWDCRFESLRGHWYLSVVSVVCCQVEASATGQSLFQRSPTDCGVSLCVIKCNNLTMVR
jgi:hypothetical protein